MRKIIFIAMFLIFSHASAAMELPEQGSDDARIYAARCSTCHSLPHPKRLDWPRWRHTLRLMQQRSAERGVSIPADDWRRIAAYLRRNAR